MTKHKLPDSPQTQPWLQMLQWALNPLKFLENSARDYGDIFTLNIGFNGRPQVIISNPQGIQEIFTADINKLDSGNPKILERDSGERYNRAFIGGQSVVTFDGDRHKQRRKLLMPPFHGERMRAYGEVINDITQQVTSKWKINEPFSVRSSTQGISFQVILKAVFGLEDGERYDKINQLLTKRLEGGNSILRILLIVFPILQKNLGPLSPWGRLKENQKKIDELIYAEIDERKANLDPSRTDILSLMMTARDENGEAMKDIELRDELMTLLFAGHETTATSLAWAFYWIHYLPEVREKLLNELDSLGENPDPNVIYQLPYLDAVCKETLRIYPPAILAFPRRVLSPIEIMGYQFEPGTMISPCIYLTHHREDIYPEPKQFKPERFLESQFSSSEYLPFGGGNRICLGMAFAKFEMKLVLATILSNWELALADQQPVKPVRRGILISPSNGVKMIVNGKRNPVKLGQDERFLTPTS
ncbi:cytochrome P450 [Crocosphaera sp. XPORK-15E]|uniref:cytochrome P450 n=1 Tax=Crocosphaera sp. XPORK-15E TaxID=3110247 RepID=UPI002B21B806|nr:cytochrome P450 [Crocosphaera sp. XPORK-15E]MEA5534924.1 cytochrome P450 [Crocosphaera sp. XPORK-15E]